MGHEFDVYIRLQAVVSAVSCGPCLLKWEERTNLPYATGMTGGVWNDMRELIPDSPLFDPWKARAMTAPSTEGFFLEDTPRIGWGPMIAASRLQNVSHRALDIRITISKTPGCPCDNDSLTVGVRQLLRWHFHWESDGQNLIPRVRPLWGSSYLREVEGL